MLDVTDPINATYVGDTDFTNPDPEALESGFEVKPEGNPTRPSSPSTTTSSSPPTRTSPPCTAIARNTTDGVEFEATQGSNTPHIDLDTSLSGQMVFVGRPCNVDPAVPAAGTAKIAVVERGLCTFTEKVGNVESAGGYEGVIVFNREVSDGCTGLLTMLVEGSSIPSLFVARDTSFGFFDVPYDDDACRDANLQPAPIAIGTLSDSIEAWAVFNGWGYVHLYKKRQGQAARARHLGDPRGARPGIRHGLRRLERPRSRHVGEERLARLSLVLLGGCACCAS